MTGIRSSALIAIGSNLPTSVGDSAQTLGHAIHSLSDSGITLTAISRFFRTPFFPSKVAPDFVNAAILVTSNQNPAGLLAELHRIEQEFGRLRVQRWGSRKLDLDLLAVGQTVLPDTSTQRHWMNMSPAAQQHQAPDQLVLPHPRLQDRAFVLVPLSDIAPDWIHPVLCKTVSQMCSDLPAEDVAAVQPV
ncbi:MAG: 2-amino-4-hydroxy-6-hydroxymethyldihydropteridine diphosphokinase [Rhodobacteraceae bacterium]|nr:2-amino-4-hydroxy-6-hydroxymethyldihydropteridine diphosphokinase [Paracoccaceae bacterium]